MAPVRKRIALVIALASLFGASLFGLSSTPAGAVSPINPDNRPTPLPNAVNGEVSASRLIFVTPSCVAAREAAPSLMRIFTMARQAQIALGAEECYRVLSDQVKYSDRSTQPGNNPACVASYGVAPSGKPVGHSMHGWGKAIDTTE